MQACGNVVDCRLIAYLNHCLRRDITEQRNLVLHAVIHRAAGPAHQNIREDSYSAEFLNAVLCGFGFEFLCGFKIGYQRNMAVHDVFTACTHCHLPYGLKKWLTLNVSYSAADFDYQDIKPFTCTDDSLLNVIRDVRNYLHRPA